MRSASVSSTSQPSSQFTNSSSDVPARKSRQAASPPSRKDKSSSSSTSKKSSSSSSSSSKLSTASREGEVLKYSEFLPKLVEERQRLETELKLLTTNHRTVKKRRRKIQRLTKERVLTIQQTTPAASPIPPAEQSSKSSKRHVKIMAPRESHGVLAMLGLSSASLSTKDRSQGSSGKKERRNKSGDAEAGETPKLAGSIAGGFARTMAAGLLTKSVSASAAIDSGTKKGTPHLTGATSMPSGMNSSSSTTPGLRATAAPAQIRREDGEGRRFFGNNKYRKYEMDVMKDDGFADLFSKFQESGIGGGEEGDDDDVSEDSPKSSNATAVTDDERAASKAKEERKSNINEESSEEKDKASESAPSGELEHITEGSESDRDKKGSEEVVENSETNSLLGSFIAMKKEYHQKMSEIDEKFKFVSGNTSERLVELQNMLRQLRREQAILRARVQTSQDDAQLLESFSVGVSLFDKNEAAKAGEESKDKRKSKKDKKKKKKSRTKSKTKKDRIDKGKEKVDSDEYLLSKKANALAEYGAEPLALVSTCSVSSVAEYGAASETSMSSVAEYGAATETSVSSVAEYGAATETTASSVAEYGAATETSVSSVAEYGAATEEPTDEEPKLRRSGGRKKRGSSKKNKERKKSASGSEAASSATEKKDSDESSSNKGNGRDKARRKKRKVKPEIRQEILLKAYHEIAYEELQFDPTPLGNGAFGVVYKALWRGTAVAVKKLMVMQFTEAEVYNFKREASIMEKYSNHPNIVKFCGISTKFPHYCIVTEFMERGCVRDALAKNPDLPWKTIVGMALDAAAGILHLHAEHIVHRDLALRNMLVGKDWRVRMADFGLARMMPKDTYAKTRGNIGAIRWLAPEVITKSVYSEKSDSYAFGIVMWELLTRGEEPFSDMSNVMEVALGIINNGLRPTIPKGTPEEYQKLMEDCWAKNADERPDFVQIHKRLSAYYATLS